jgi:hypothetical protein
MHVDEFINGNYGKDKYARWWFTLFRLPAALKIDFATWMKQYKLYCNYQNKRYQVTGCSRMGDVWLHADLLYKGDSYQLRVDLAQCSAWGPTP